MDTPGVSVILPVKNGARYLAAAIDSVLRQDYAPLELIVVHASSTDDTAQIAESFPAVRCLVEPDGEGLAGARNLGIREAAGELIAFISHDDLWTADKLRVQVDFMRRNPAIEYTITRVRYFREPNTALPAGFRTALLNEEPIGPMPETLLARASLFRKIGGFDAEYRLGEDVDWFVRAGRLGIAMGVIPRALLRKRVHDTNLSCRLESAAQFHQDVLAIARRSIQNRHGLRVGS